MLLIPKSLKPLTLSAPTYARGALTKLRHSFFMIWFIGIEIAVCSPSRADGADVINLEGLSLPCADCQINADDQCLIRSAPGEDMILMPCSQAVDSILQRLATNPDNSARPSVPELRSFLIGTTQPSGRALNCIKILLRTEAGEAAIIESAATLYSKYPEELTKVVLLGAGTNSLLHALWDLPAISGVHVNGALKAAIVHRDSSLTTDDLIDSLPLADINLDLNELKQIRLALANLGNNEDAAIISQVIQVLRSCIDPAPDNHGCKTEAVATLSPTAQRYLSRASVAQVIAATRGTKIPPAEKLQLVARTDYRNFRTPDLHGVVLDALREIIRTEDTYARVVFLDSPNRILLSFFALNDPGIAKAYAGLLSKSADEAIERNDFASGISFLEESFDIYPSESDVRNALIVSAHLVAGVTDDPQLRARRDALESRINGVNSASTILIGAAVVFGIIGVGLIAIAIKLRQKTLESTGVVPPSLTVIERAQLRELLSSFGLAGNATEEQLTKAYRVKARQLHPDTGAGATEEFTELTERYKQARDLISTRDIG